MEADVKYFPKFAENNLAFIREEKDGYCTIKSKSRGDFGTFVANTNAMKIIHLCDGTRALNRIYLEFAAGNPSIPLEKIKENVDTVLKEIHVLELLDWADSKNPFQVRRRKEDYILMENGDEISAYQEEDIDKVVQFLGDFNLPCPKDQIKTKEKNVVYISPFCSGVEFNKLAIRLRTFQCYEAYFLSFQAGKPTGVIGIRGYFLHNDIDAAKIAMVSLIIFKDRNTIDRNIKLLDFALSRFEEYLVTRDIVKVRFFINKIKHSQSEYLLNLLGKVGFSEECCLKDETGIGENLYYFTKRI